MVNRDIFGLNAVQRQSLVISLTAFFTSLLLIALVSVLILISFRGTAYFWPEPIYKVTGTLPDGSRFSVLANIFEDASEEDIGTSHSITTILTTSSTSSPILQMGANDEKATP